MSFDRFVYWRQGVQPTREQLQWALEDYVRDLATEVTWNGDRFMVLLPGRCSNPAARVVESELLRSIAQEESEHERWFEVHVGTDNVDVITRRGDWITNAIATEFAKICAQFWQGELEMG